MPEYALAPSMFPPISALSATSVETRAPESAVSRAAQRPAPDLAELERVVAEARQQRAGHVADLLSGAWQRVVPRRSRRTGLGRGRYGSAGAVVGRGVMTRRSAPGA